MTQSQLLNEECPDAVYPHSYNSRCEVAIIIIFWSLVWQSLCTEKIQIHQKTMDGSNERQGFGFNSKYKDPDQRARL